MSAKPTLILLPGLLCDDALWTHQAESLGDIADVQVADLTGTDTMTGLAQGVLADAPQTFALAGLSMGGYVAQEIMRQAPGRVEKLALLDTNARADLPEQSERRKALMAEAQGGKFLGIGPQLLPALVHPDHAPDPRIRDIVLGMAERVGLEGFLNQQHAIMGRVDGRADLSKIACPTLVLCGDEDQLTPLKVHQEMVDAIGANAHLETVEHSGHLSPIEQPEAVTAAMRAWLMGG